MNSHQVLSSTGTPVHIAGLSRKPAVCAGFSISRLLQIAILSGLCLASAERARAQTETVLHSFGVEDDDGASPAAGLVWHGGALYGTTSYGGPNRSGAIFELTPDGGETVIAGFYSGANPLDSPVVGGATYFEGLGQLFYATTSTGGHLNCGTIDLESSSGDGVPLYDFSGGADGCSPVGGLVRTGDSFYGTASGGGAYGAGTVFEITKVGPYFQYSYKVVYTFTGGVDGAAPEGTLIRDEQGNLYGTTNGGGAYGFGTVFEIDTAGVETVLYSFKGGADGANPSGDLLKDSKNNFYGTTSSGGAFGVGTVYKVSASGVETILHSFAGGADGANPSAGLLRGEKGYWYGTTAYGGTGTICEQYQSQNGCGTVFAISPKGAKTVLYSFTGGTDGWMPLSKLTRDKQGNLYGTTYLGGASESSGCVPLGCGVAFKITLEGSQTLRNYRQ